MNIMPMRQTSAWFPIACSVTAVGLVMGHHAVFGAVQASGGSAAQVFQMLMVAQAPVILYFLVRYVPRRPRAALYTLLLQALAAAAAFAAVIFYA